MNNSSNLAVLRYPQSPHLLMDGALISLYAAHHLVRTFDCNRPLRSSSATEVTVHLKIIPHFKNTKIFAVPKSINISDIVSLINVPSFESIFKYEKEYTGD